MGAGPMPGTVREPQANGLPFRLAACQLFHFALFRSAGVVAGVLRLFPFDLLAGGSLGIARLFGGLLGWFSCVLLCSTSLYLPCLRLVSFSVLDFVSVPVSYPGTALAMPQILQSRPPLQGLGFLLAARSRNSTLSPAARTSPPASSNRSEEIVP